MNMHRLLGLMACLTAALSLGACSYESTDIEDSSMPPPETEVHEHHYHGEADADVDVDADADRDGGTTIEMKVD